MIKFETRTTVHCPSPKVYEVLMNLELLPQWLTGLKKVEPLSGVPGEEGFIANYIFEERGKEIVFREEVISITPGAKFTYVLESDAIWMEATTRLENKNSETEIVTSNKVKAKKWMMNLLLPFLKGMMKKRQNEDMNKEGGTSLPW